MKINQPIKKISIKFFLIILLSICIFSLVLLFKTFHQSFLAGQLRPEYHKNGGLHFESRILNVTEITTWMTFDYINVIFNLPPNFLATSLNINETHYPNMTLQAYARHHKLNPQALLFELRAAIINYQAQK